jgi:hypothetical protein
MNQSLLFFINYFLIELIARSNLLSVGTYMLSKYILGTCYNFLFK